MRRVLGTSIAARSSAMIVAVVLAVGVLLLAALLPYTAHRAEAEHHAQDIASLDMVRDTLAIACFLGDKGLAASVAEGLLIDPSVMRVRVTAGGVTLAERHSTSGASTSADAPAGGRIVRKVMSPFNAGEVVGEIVLVPDAAEIRRHHVIPAVMLTAIPMVVLVLFTAIAAAWVTFRQIARPIALVSARVHALKAEQGERVVVPTGNEADEVGRLVLDVNALVERLGRLLGSVQEAERRLSESQRLGHIGSWYVDRLGLLTWSPELYRLHGLAPDAVVGRVDSFLGLLESGDRASVGEWLDACKAGLGPPGVVYRCELPDGSHRWFRMEGDAAFGSEGFTYMAGTAQDVTELELIEQELRDSNIALQVSSESNAIAAAVIAHASEGVMVTDADLQIQSVNPAFEAITGFSADEAVGQTPRILMSGKHDAEFFRALRESVESEGQWSGEIWNRRRSGEIYPQRSSIKVLRDADGKARHYATVFSDTTEQNRLEARLRELSSTDGLTGLANRRTFDETIAAEWARAARNLQPLSLLMIDIDQFKLYNDREGHPAGDECLRQVARAIGSAARRPGDLAARYGGEEFVVLLPTTPAEGAAAVAERLRAGVEALALPHRASTAAPVVTVSVGVGTIVLGEEAIPGDVNPASHFLIMRADRALYEAKHTGRNRVVSAGQADPEAGVRERSVENVVPVA